ncbi:MAG: alpha/beta fold hydrolase [Candidatus Algichlamydia australiensis]|nr:alpha/beta fold hydrolase [Chlamydiales bacterium]
MRKVFLTAVLGMIALFSGEGKISFYPNPEIEGGQIEVYSQVPDITSKKLIVTLGGADNPGIKFDDERRTWFEHWLNKGYCVALVALPGFGESSGRRDLHGPLSVKTLSHAIDALIAEYQIEQTGVIGFGYGGATALLLTAQRDDINCLVCANGLGNLQRMKNNPSWMSRFLSRNYNFNYEDEDALRARVPYYHVDKMHTPLYILHRFPHRWVDFEGVNEFVQAMREKGRECQVAIQQKRPEDHPTRVSMEEVLEVTEEWFDQHMEKNGHGV